MSAPITIRGAGPVGLAFALFAHAQGIAVTVREAKSRAAWQAANVGNGRSVALAHGSRQLLERIHPDGWAAIAAAGAAPIRTIHVEQAQGFGHAQIAHHEHGIDALGYVVRLGALTQALGALVEARGIVVQFDAGDTPTGEGLTIQAEGAPEQLTELKDYGQSALVAEVTLAEAATQQSKLDHAFEYFTPSGPLAMLPLDPASGTFSLVWCRTHAEAARQAALDDTALLAELQAAFGQRLGTLGALKERGVFPLRLARGVPSAPTTIALGNAAQTLHPVAGQGLNLGLRDAFECAALLAREIDAGVALNDPHQAARIASHFGTARARDRDATVRLTDAYVSVFSNDITALNWARGIGLSAISGLAPLRYLVAQRMMLGARGDGLGDFLPSFTDISDAAIKLRNQFSQGLGGAPRLAFPNLTNLQTTAQQLYAQWKGARR